MPNLTEAASSEARAFRAMFAARKRVIIDLLRWDLPVLADVRGRSIRQPTGRLPNPAR